MRPYGKLRFTYIKCQRCGEIKPISEAVGVEFLQGMAAPMRDLVQELLHRSIAGLRLKRGWCRKMKCTECPMGAYCLKLVV